MPVTGATSAAPGQIIKSAIWDNINSDVGAALTQLGQGSPVANIPRVVTVMGCVTVATTDNTIYITVSSVTNINLPLSSLKTGPVAIMGTVSGIFGTTNAALTPSGGQTISGLASVTLNTNFQVARLYPIASGGWVLG